MTDAFCYGSFVLYDFSVPLCQIDSQNLISKNKTNLKQADHALFPYNQKKKAFWQVPVFEVDESCMKVYNHFGCLKCASISPNPEFLGHRKRHAACNVQRQRSIEQALHTLYLVLADFFLLQVEERRDLLSRFHY